MCYPPGIPILAPGERITKEILNYIEYAKAKGCSMTGPEEMCIRDSCHYCGNCATLCTDCAALCRDCAQTCATCGICEQWISAAGLIQMVKR